MMPGVLQRSGAIPVAFEGSHESEGDPRAVRILVREGPQPLDGLIRPTLPLRRLGERLERPGLVPEQSLPLRVDPPLEPGRVGQVEAVEERRRLELDRATPFLPFDRVTELLGVAREELPIEAQLVSGRHQDLVSRSLIDPVDRVREEPTRALGVRVRPQVADDLLPGEASIASERQKGQQRDPAALHRASRQRSLRTLQCGGPEEPEPKHGRPDEGGARSGRRWGEESSSI